MKMNHFELSICMEGLLIRQGRQGKAAVMEDAVLFLRCLAVQIR